MSVRSIHNTMAKLIYIRGLFETFHINGPTGKHLCLVQPPMHMTIQELQRQNSLKRLHKKLLNWTFFNLLSALSFLHDEAKVIHTGGFVMTRCLEHLIDDLKQISVPRTSCWLFMISLSSQNLNKRKLRNHRRRKLSMKIAPFMALANLIYQRTSFGATGQPVLCEFGEARIGQSQKGLIQPRLYRYIQGYDLVRPSPNL